MNKLFTHFFIASLLFLCSTIVTAQTKSIVINEVMSSNTSTLPDSEGSYEDWIELYNNSDEGVSLNGYYLTDNPSKPRKWQFPDVTIKAKSFLLIWASEKTGITSELHAGIKISKDGEPIILSDPAGNKIDEYAAVAIPDNVSYGRFPDGSNQLHFFPASSPATVNSSPANTVILNELMSSNKSTLADARGAFEDWIEIYNYGNLPVNMEGFFLSDDEAAPKQWQFPATILQPNAFLLVWASGLNGINNEQLHTNFKIGKSGEPILLSNSDGAMLDKIDAIDLGDDISYGRYADGEQQLQMLTIATPGSVNILNEPAPEVNAGLAQVHINTNGIPVTSKDERIEAYLTIKNSTTFNYPQQGIYTGKIGIKGRGNTSWTMPKKPYSIELRDENGEGIDAPMLDMPAEEDWALIANYSDKSLMRNYIAYDFSNKIGVYAPKARFVDVYMNEEYIGNYLLTETIKRGANRVPIKKLSDKAEDQIEPAISGGYLLEITPADRLEGQTYITTNKTNLSFELKSPKEDEITEAQAKWITAYLNEFETALFGADFANPETGYAKYIDADTFIDWILINELARNNDAALHASVYVYKDRDGKLKLGPVWDFDIAFGNINYNDGWKTDGWYVKNASWFRQLFKDPVFVEKYIKRWQEIRPQVDELSTTIDATAALLGESAAKNFERWPILGEFVWPNPTPFANTYQEEVDNLKSWIASRSSWIDKNIEYLRVTTPAKPVSLLCGTFNFTEWNANAAPGTSPVNMEFLQTQQKDPGVAAALDKRWQLAFDLTKKSRFNGLGEDGISFTNTSDKQSESAGYVGAVLVSINTLNTQDISVSWTAGTVAPNNRIYALRMQYRLGNTGPFKDVLNAEGNPIEYIRNEVAGHKQRFERILLPEEAENTPVVQVIWRYYQVSTDIDGSRPELNLDDISVSAVPIFMVSTDANTAVCAGEEVTLTTNLPGTANFIWQHNGEDLAESNAPSLVAKLPGQYKVKYKTTDGCEVYTNAISVSWYETPQTPEVVLNNGKITSTIEGTKYIWTKDGEILDHSANNLNLTESGTYTVKVITKYGCESEFSAPYNYTITGIKNKLPRLSSTIFPNPSTGNIYILPNENLQDVSITITDVTGKIYHKDTYNLLPVERETLIRILPKGLYIVKVSNSKGILVEKVLVK